MASHNCLTTSEEEAIVNAIQNAEKHTSGEIKVHIELHCTQDPVKRATQVFRQLGMHITKEQNGVLLYVAVNDRKFSIIADKGIHAKVSPDFLAKTKDTVLQYFKQGEMAVGLVTGIACAAEQLKGHFPYQKEDENELSDNISIGK